MLSVTFTIARLVYWGSAARELARNPGPGRFEALVSQAPFAFWLAGAIGVCAYGALVKAANGTVLAATRAGPNQPLQSTSGELQRAETQRQ